MPLQVAAVLIASFGAGIISSMFGVGGGIVFVPAMLLVLGLGMHKAAPTSQLTLMMTAIAGVFTHSVLGHPDYLQAVTLSAGAFVEGCATPTIIGSYTNRSSCNLYFGWA
jgi:uncharacterized membrane protein YfcA